jgi:hypothetical protein
LPANSKTRQAESGKRQALLPTQLSGRAGLGASADIAEIASRCMLQHAIYFLITALRPKTARVRGLTVPPALLARQRSDRLKWRDVCFQGRSRHSPLGLFRKGISIGWVGGDEAT